MIDSQQPYNMAFIATMHNLPRGLMEAIIPDLMLSF